MLILQLSASPWFSIKACIGTNTNAKKTVSKCKNKNAEPAEVLLKNTQELGNFLNLYTSLAFFILPRDPQHSSNRLNLSLFSILFFLIYFLVISLQCESKYSFLYFFPWITTLTPSSQRYEEELLSLDGNSSGGWWEQSRKTDSIFFFTSICK